MKTMDTIAVYSVYLETSKLDLEATYKKESK
jgi:hypothetical protein